MYDRRKDNKWILQKNINDKKLILSMVGLLTSNPCATADDILQKSKACGVYKGRSVKGSPSTFGVRMSQVCFYMFGYKKDKEFIPSVSTQFLSMGTDESIVAFINLFSMQYPHPNSTISSNFQIYIGRLMVKLLLDERLDGKIYYDEFVWFLVFLETIDEVKYEQLIKDIKEYRALTFDEKLKLFQSVYDYHGVFSNATHEVRNYFSKIFTSFGVFETYIDKKSLSFDFIQGKDTIRKLFYNSYITLNSDLIDYAKCLISIHSPFLKPKLESDYMNRDDWVRELYEFDMLEYFYDIKIHRNRIEKIRNIIESMPKEAKYGSNDGKSFENILGDCFELFREVQNVSKISGAGNTDILCNISIKLDNFKINVDAKKRKDSLEGINPVRIDKHIKKHGSRYAIIVASKFTRGVADDINNYAIALVEAETLANYLLKECLSSQDGQADFCKINEIINKSYGKDITREINSLIVEKYSVKL